MLNEVRDTLGCVFVLNYLKYDHLMVVKFEHLATISWLNEDNTFLKKIRRVFRAHFGIGPMFRKINRDFLQSFIIPFPFIFGLK